jgi:hypothetical protein
VRPARSGRCRSSKHGGATPSSTAAAGAEEAPDLRKNPQLYAGLAAAGSTAAPDAGAVGTTGSLRGDDAADWPAQLPAAPTKQLHKPEVLAPAGGWPQLKAAVENGADAVYFGLSDFNARAR